MEMGEVEAKLEKEKFGEGIQATFPGHGWCSKLWTKGNIL